MSTPAISVIMPVFNAERYLAEAIESILNQTFRDFEFLIFDDGSTDRSSAIIREYAGKDARIIAGFLPVNKGYVTHLNEGIRRSRGQYIARMDSDDVALPTRLELQKKFLADNLAVGVVGSSCIKIDENNKEIGPGVRLASPSYLFWQIFFVNPFSHPTVMYRKEAVVSISGYDESRMPAEDYNLWTRILDNWEFSNIEEPLLKYREHRDSVSATKKDIQFRRSCQSQVELWKKWLDIDLSDDEVRFLRLFHLGYDDLPAEAAYPMFSKIKALRRFVMSRFRDIDSRMHEECFGRCLYLASKMRGRMYPKMVAMVGWLLLKYPVLSVKWLVNGRI
jgi:glycosyltransferase involved in cell wall biosynthesis